MRDLHKGVLRVTDADPDSLAREDVATLREMARFYRTGKFAAALLLALVGLGAGVVTILGYWHGAPP